VEDLGEGVLNQKIPFITELAHKYVGVDPLEELIPVRPAVHYTMGGIHVDTYGRVLAPDGSWVRGLWAAGEAAAVSVHGANRLGSNSLSECSVWGRLTGEAAAKYAMEAPTPSTDERYIEAAQGEESRIFDKLLHKETGGISVYELKGRLQDAMEQHFGPFRQGSTMKEGIPKLLKIREDFANVRVEDGGRVYNQNLKDALELDGMIDAALAVAYGALARQESRGAHYRLDYPRRDDENWLKHTVAFFNGGQIQLSYIPVRITKWTKFEERKY